MHLGRFLRTSHQPLGMIREVPRCLSWKLRGGPEPCPRAGLALWGFQYSRQGLTWVLGKGGDERSVLTVQNYGEGRELGKQKSSRSPWAPQ